ncbi:DEAD/DEAH box helicase [Streptomyces sp. B21-105]|uniref:DEAD/DEAH box helicase n=1 Tax=Streptomyces sp. B21-105 TaxID=3039417 RepID=UPI003FA6B1DA
MDVFGVHRALIKDYRSFTQGGTVIRGDRVAAFVEDDLNSKSQWPDPWLSLNPFFQGGGTVVELAGQKVLHDERARIFQARKTEGGTVPHCRPLMLHQHQREAVDAAASGAAYVLTTGTGSGKPLAYIVPIVTKVLHQRDTEGPKAPKRVRAIIVYPMNALANSHGSYRTEELTLAEYDRMAAAGLTLENPLVEGENYTSTLTPAPGHGPRHSA